MPDICFLVSRCHLAAAAAGQLELATFQTEAAPSVVHCPDIRDSGVGSYTVTQDQLEECRECSGQLITLQSQLAMRRAAAAMCRY